MKIVGNVEEALKSFIDQFVDLIGKFKSMIEELVDRLQNLNK